MATCFNACKDRHEKEEQLPADLQAEMRLKRIWMLVQEES
jgi:hypothetical protein